MEVKRILYELAIFLKAAIWVAISVYVALLAERHFFLDHEPFDLPLAPAIEEQHHQEQGHAHL